MSGSLTFTVEFEIVRKTGEAGTTVRVVGVSRNGRRRLSAQPTAALSLQEVLDGIGGYLGLGVPDLSAPFWSGLTTTPINALAWAETSDAGLSASLDLTYTQTVDLPGEGALRDLFGKLVSVDGLTVAYERGKLSLKARIETATSVKDSITGRKQQLVSYPFPAPASAAPPVFELKYLGLGQRVGPTPVTSAVDPLAAIFDALAADLATSDPKDMLTRLATNFYQPQRDWFVAADVSLRGFRVRALFNDPDLYGLEVTVGPGGSSTLFNGLLFEILYQKLGPGLGVYYGALTLPDDMRRIDIDGVILLLPGFSIWVYTNGDFRLNVGWPLGAGSIGVIAGIATGHAGFFFAKLRSADAPGKQDGPQFNPILQFGIAMELDIGLDVSAGPLSAQMSVTYQAILQGVVAWLDTSEIAPPKPSTLMTQPDHFWFAGAVAEVILIQGSIDFCIIKASLTIRFAAQAQVAYETDCATVLTVSAEVSVEVSIHVLFFSISLSFDMTVSHTFVIGSGDPALVDRPRRTGLAFSAVPLPNATGDDGSAAATAPAAATVPTGPPSSARLPPPPPAPASAAPALEDRARAFASRLADARAGKPVGLDATFALLPTAIFEDKAPSGAFALVAMLAVEAPEPGATASASLTAFETLTAALLGWLLRYVAKDHESATDADLNALAVDALGHGSAPPGGAIGDRDNYLLELKRDLPTVLALNLKPAAEAPGALPSGALLPLPDALTLTAGDAAPLDLAASRVTPQYVDWINKHYAGQGLGPSTANNGTKPTEDYSLAHLIFGDYVLLLLRQTVASLVFGPGAADFAHALAGLDMASLSGFASRFLVSGMRLPELGALAGDSDPPTAPLYRVAGQQFAATGASASASLRPTAQDPQPQGGSWIAPAAGVTSSIALPATPPAAPQTRFTVWQAKAVAETPLRVSLTRQTRLVRGGAQAALLALPAQLLALARPPDGLSLALTVEAPGDVASACGNVAPALLIPLSIGRLACPPPGGASPWLTGRYVLAAGPDEATRELLHALLTEAGLLRGKAKPDAAKTLDATKLQISLLTSTGGGDGLREAPVVAATPLTLGLARTRPAAAAKPRGARDDGAPGAEGGDVDDCAAADAAAAPGDFLRLLWEAIVDPAGMLLIDASALGGDEDKVFAQSLRASVDILVVLPGQAAPFPAWATHLRTDRAPKQTLWCAALTAAGQPYTVAMSSLPAGAFGFEAEAAQIPPLPGPREIDATHLYHLIQYAADDPKPRWSLPVGPARPSGQTDNNAWFYHQVVQPTAGAYGSPQSLRFRLLDVFGNVAPADSAPPRVTFVLRYTDRLISPAQWPGVRLSYAFAPRDIESATLLLRLQFKIAALDADQLALFSARYGEIRSQLDDAVTAQLATDLDAQQPQETDKPLKETLLAYAADVAAELAKPTGAVIAAEAARPVRFADILAAANKPESGVRAVMPISVSVALSRPEDLVDPDDRRRLPELARVIAPVPPDLDNPSGKNGLGAFAAAFETAFAHLDGAAGATRLRLAQRAGLADAEATNCADLWAIRCGPLGVSVKPAGATSYALRPLADQPLSGVFGGAVRAHVDLDASATACLRAIDAALTPARAVALARLDAAPGAPSRDLHRRLLAAKRQLAAAIPTGLAKILLDDPDGDPAAARAALETALLQLLASAATITTVVQLKTEFAAFGVLGDDADNATPPVLSGDVAASLSRDETAPLDGEKDSEKGHFFFSSASVAIAGPKSLALTTMLSVAEPSGGTELKVDLSWSPAFLQHEFEQDETYSGFTPSAFVQFLRPEPAPWLKYAGVVVPTPLWSDPAAPHLREHAAKAQPFNAPSGPLADAAALAAALEGLFVWSYEVNLSATLSAQDELWFSPGFNALPGPAETGAVPAPLQPLFDAVVGMEAALPGYDAPLKGLDGLDAAQTPPLDLADLLAPFVDLAEALARAWPRTPLAVPAATPSVAPDAFRLTAVQPDPAVDAWMLTLARPAGAGAADPWPQLSLGDKTLPAAAEAPIEGGRFVGFVFALDAKPNLSDLRLHWPGLHLSQRMTADFSCLVRRDATFDKRPADQALALRTQKVAFPTSAVPSIRIAGRLPLAPAWPLADMLAGLIGPLAALGGETREPALSLAVKYSYAMPLAAGEGLRAETPALIAVDLPLPADAGPALGRQLAGEIADWIARARPSSRGGAIELSLTLFGAPLAAQAQRVALVRLENVYIAVENAAAGFWPSAGGGTRT